jgi:hypothetical protein
MVDKKEIVGDGNWTDITFTYPVKQSSWVALRIPASSHTNPVFVILNSKPIRIKASAEWCRKAIDQCWKMKKSNIRQEELAAAEAAYNHARKVYEKVSQEGGKK